MNRKTHQGPPIGLKNRKLPHRTLLYWPCTKMPCFIKQTKLQNNSFASKTEIVYQTISAHSTSSSHPERNIHLPPLEIQRIFRPNCTLLATQRGRNTHVFCTCDGIYTKQIQQLKKMNCSLFFKRKIKISAFQPQKIQYGNTAPKFALRLSSCQSDSCHVDRCITSKLAS